jgi:hypothetical protein
LYGPAGVKRAVMRAGSNGLDLVCIVEWQTTSAGLIPMAGFYAADDADAVRTIIRDKASQSLFPVACSGEAYEMRIDREAR